jgi:mercuric ion transport protein
MVPGVILALLPSATCPACIAAYAGVLSAVGLGFLFDDRYLTPLIVAFLVLGNLSVAWSTRSHRNPWPLICTIIGSFLVAAGRLVWSAPSLLYIGVAVLIAASLGNLWLKRRRPQPLVQLGLGAGQ